MAKYVYQISGENLGDINYLKSQGYIDVTVSCYGTPPCMPAKLSTILNAGMSPMCTGGNDAHSMAGWDGRSVPDVYGGLASAGWMAGGGEATSAEEMMAAQNYITFITFGGCYGDSLDPFAHGFQVVKGGHGVIAYLESYCDHTLEADWTINACVHATQAGCFEVGIMIGEWMPVDAGTYINLADRVISAGGKFSGFSLWNGCNSDMTATAQLWANAIREMQGSFPPDNRNLKTRISGGVTPPPPPNPPDYTAAYSVLFE